MSEQNFKGQPFEYTGKTRPMFGQPAFEIVITDGRNKGDTHWIKTPPSTPADKRALKAASKVAAAKATKKTKEPKVARAKPDAEADAPAGPKLVYGLKVGQQLRKPFKGGEVVVDITEAGYEVDGQTFRTITGAAKHITGYGISGPVFFGLVGGGDK